SLYIFFHVRARPVEGVTEPATPETLLPSSPTPTSTPGSGADGHARYSSLGSSPGFTPDDCPHRAHPATART
ncbi:hypothetical protein Dimus_023139, partial [Dionaea muscipula]